MSDIQERLSTLFDDMLEETDGCEACKHYDINTIGACNLEECIVEVTHCLEYKFQPKPVPVKVYGVRFEDGTLELFKTFIAADRVYQNVRHTELITFKEEMNYIKEEMK